jgi:hypothetical protein
MMDALRNRDAVPPRADAPVPALAHTVLIVPYVSNGRKRF